MAFDERPVITAKRKVCSRLPALRVFVKYGKNVFRVYEDDSVVECRNFVDDNYDDCDKAYIVVGWTIRHIRCDGTRHMENGKIWKFYGSGRAGNLREGCGWREEYLILLRAIEADNIERKNREEACA